MSSSTRKVIHKFFGSNLPVIDKLDLARGIFAIETPPGSQYISGVVDQLGICLPGINRLFFDNNYWPYKIESIIDEDILRWLQSHVFLKKTKPRPKNYEVITGVENFNKKLIQVQANLGDIIWNSIQNKDLNSLGIGINSVHENQKSIIPGYESKYIRDIIMDTLKHHIGCKIMGAGGYGYVMVVTDSPTPDLIPVILNEK